jgi:hypothetical protein
MDSSKDKLVLNIKEWIKTETEITDLRKKLREKTEKRKLLTEELVSVMKTNSIDCFDTNGGSLIYKTSKVKKTITAKTLLATLQNYYESDPNIAAQLTQYILDNREEQTKEYIKHKVYNK